LRSCRNKREVQALLNKEGRDAANEAWRALDPAARGALQLVRAFDGVIVPEFDDQLPGDLYGDE
jgi:hypothetical protein